MATNDSKKTVRKVRGVKSVKVEKPYVEPPVAPDATPIYFTTTPPNPQMKSPVYSMKCWAGDYKASSWLGLGWMILKHRVWHLCYDGKFQD